MAGHDVSEYNKSLVEVQITMLGTGQIVEEVFKINVSIILQINLYEILK
jgi:hypothetical protein